MSTPAPEDWERAYRERARSDGRQSLFVLGVSLVVAGVAYICDWETARTAPMWWLGGGGVAILVVLVWRSK